MATEDELIAAHLERQRGVPDGYVRLDNGSLRPVGGNNDNASPARDSDDYLPDPEWAKE